MVIPKRGKDKIGTFYKAEGDEAEPRYYTPKDLSSRTQAMIKAVRDGKKGNSSSSVPVPVQTTTKPVKSRSSNH